MIYEDLIKQINPSNIFVNEKMSRHTSFKVGGIADYFIIVNDIKELIYILKLSKKLTDE